MKPAFLRTLSARIVLGFFVLMSIFGTVSGYTIYKMHELGRELTFLRTAYLEISLGVAQLLVLQGMIVDYLDSEDLRKPLVLRNNQERRKILNESAARLDALQNVPPDHRPAVASMRRRIEFFLGEYAANGALYQAALERDVALAEAERAMARVEQNERRLQQKMREWFNELRSGVEVTTTELEEAEAQARLAALALGVLAGLVGLTVTLWAVHTLRPLRRLRDGARRIARGEYDKRVEVAGETEVAEVAAEFNAMAQAVQEREQDLVRSARLAAIGKMAAVITHEIRNPLSSIGLNAELLEDELDAAGAPDDAKKICRTIQKEVDRLNGITEEYLRFARMPRPKLDLEKPNVVVADLVKFQKEALGHAGVEVVADLDEDVPAVLVDEGQLRQALLNLFRNAADAMNGKGGELRVSTSRAPDGGVEVRISDTGPGIPPEEVPLIFEPFFSTKEGGTGLGLALSQQIIREHGGRIEVTSEPGKGTTFVVWLPAT